MLVKGMGYYADAEAVKTAHIKDNRQVTTVHQGNGSIQHRDGERWPGSGANRRSVWSDISPEPYGGAHFATFPSDLPRICIQASTSEKGVCPECGAQWARVVDHKNMEVRQSGHGIGTGMRTSLYGTEVEPASTTTLDWRATCSCDAGNPVPAVVLDPFCGTATTCLAAQKLGRRAVGVDLSKAYLQQAVNRLGKVSLPLF
jgi:hypothetical protein